MPSQHREEGSGYLDETGRDLVMTEKNRAGTSGWDHNFDILEVKYRIP
jgi:hypothetical protein